MSSLCYLAFGANLGARESHVLEAVTVLSRRIGPLVRLSSLYETDPVGTTGPSFINAVASFRCDQAPHEILAHTQRVQREAGRTSGHLEPRELDVDIIAYGDVIVDDETLTIPHPRYHQRNFVTVPLREISPGFVCPRHDRHINTMLDSTAGRDEVRAVSRRRWGHRSWV